MRKVIATIAVLGIVYASLSFLFQLWFVASSGGPDDVAREGATNPPCSLELVATFQLGRLPYFASETFIWLPEGCNPEPAQKREQVLFGGLALSVSLSLGVLGSSFVATRALLGYARASPRAPKSRNRGHV